MTQLIYNESQLPAHLAHAPRNIRGGFVSESRFVSLADSFVSQSLASVTVVGHAQIRDDCRDAVVQPRCQRRALRAV
jgi:hypothetical protein